MGLSGSAIVLDSPVSAFTVKFTGPAVNSSTLNNPECFPEEIKSRSNQLQGIFGIRLAAVDFQGKGVLTTYPVASSYTTTRHPETYARLDAIVSRLRSWMTLKLTLNVPPILSILVDADSLIAFERLFAFIFKVHYKASEDIFRNYSCISYTILCSTGSLNWPCD